MPVNAGVVCNGAVIIDPTATGERGARASPSWNDGRRRPTVSALSHLSTLAGKVRRVFSCLHAPRCVAWCLCITSVAGLQQIAELLFGETGILDDLFHEPPRQLPGVDRDQRRASGHWMSVGGVGAVLAIEAKAGLFEDADQFSGGEARQARQHTSGDGGTTEGDAETDQL